MTPELKRAVFRFVPDYFFWNEKRREQYHVDKPEEDQFRIYQFLLKELFDISVSNLEEVSDEIAVLDDVQATKFNATWLLIGGIGEDYFLLNKFFRDEKNILSFKTLYDYDFDHFKYQEEHRIEMIENYHGRQYKGSLYLRWARLMIDNAFTYANLSMVANYLCDELESYAMEYLERLIPHEFVDRKIVSIPIGRPL